MRSRLVIGMMTGTSLDGLDAALVRIEGEGLGMKATVVRTASRPFGELGATLRAIAEQTPMTAGVMARAALELGELHARAAAELAGGETVDLVCVHGQTVFHQPPVSWQMIQPAPIARALKAPVLFDLRAADLAAGGQGAPITPVADWVLFHRPSPNDLRFAREHDEMDRLATTIGPARLKEFSLPRPCVEWAIVNLGGFCNATVVRVDTDEPQETLGFDICTCNQLLDAIARRLMNVPFDIDGAEASSGQIHREALEDLFGMLRSQSGARRSLGTGDEVGEWISRFRAFVGAADLAATACEAIGQMIDEKLGRASRIILAGGGVRNATLREAIKSCCSRHVEVSDDHGVPASYREAICFAVLGGLCQDRVPITLPKATGVSEPAPVAGVWVYPP